MTARLLIGTRLSIRVASTVLLAFVLASVDARADGSVPTIPSPSLTGETFTGTPSIVSAQCDINATSTFTYAVAGQAAGPYVGFFFETGTVTVGPTAVPGGGAQGALITSFQASFVILSQLGVVTGTKHSPPGIGSAICFQQSGVTLIDFNFPITPQPAAYSARLPDGCRDEGQSTMALNYDIVNGQTIFRIFTESFVSSSVTCAGLPGDDDD